MVYESPVPEIKDSFLCVNNETGAILAPVTLNTGQPNSNHTFVWTLDGEPYPATGNEVITDVPGTYTVTVTNTFTGCTASGVAVVGTSSLAIADYTVGID